MQQDFQFARFLTHYANAVFDCVWHKGKILMIYVKSDEIVYWRLDHLIETCNQYGVIVIARDTWDIEKLDYLASL